MVRRRSDADPDAHPVSYTDPLADPDSNTHTVAHADSGVVEGFYGRPWSWRKRHHLLATLAADGMTAYLYAPKNDPLHRDRWREPYPAADLDRFAALAATIAVTPPAQSWAVRRAAVELAPRCQMRYFPFPI